MTSGHLFPAVLFYFTLLTRAAPQIPGWMPANRPFRWLSKLQIKDERLKVAATKSYSWGMTLAAVCYLLDTFTKWITLPWSIVELALVAFCFGQALGFWRSDRKIRHRIEATELRRSSEA